MNYKERNSKLELLRIKYDLKYSQYIEKKIRLKY